jgi:hypothetical protein
VARVGDEAAHPLLAGLAHRERALDVADHRVHRGAHLSYFGARVGLGHPDVERHLAPRQRRPRHLRRRGGDLLQRPERAPDHDAAADPGDQQQHGARAGHHQRDAGDGLLRRAHRQPGHEHPAVREPVGDHAVVPQGGEVVAARFGRYRQPGDLPRGRGAHRLGLAGGAHGRRRHHGPVLDDRAERADRRTRRAQEAGPVVVPVPVGVRVVRVRQLRAPAVAVQPLGVAPAAPGGGRQLIVDRADQRALQRQHGHHADHERHRGQQHQDERDEPCPQGQRTAGQQSGRAAHPGQPAGLST